MSKNRSIFAALGVTDSSLFGGEKLNPRKTRELFKAVSAGANAVSDINEARASFNLVEASEIKLERERLELRALRSKLIEDGRIRRTLWEVVEGVAVDTYEKAAKKSA